VRTVGFVVLVAVAVAAAIGANFLLLGYGGKSKDPVGRLTPRLAELAVHRPGSSTPPPPPSPSDDDHGRGHGHDDD